MLRKFLEGLTFLKKKKNPKIQIFSFWTLQPSLSGIPGIAAAILQSGGENPESHRKVDSEAMARL